eukprot:6474235-Amphidinium_carterae.1
MTALSCGMQVIRIHRKDDKAEEENWFAAPGQRHLRLFERPPRNHGSCAQRHTQGYLLLRAHMRCKRGQYATEARQLLLNDFSMLCKQ